MADAYDVMSMAKRSGAALQQKEDWEAYQDELAAAQAKRSKGGFWSGLANMGIAKLLPMLIPGVGAGAGLMSLLGVGAARAATQYGLGEAVRSMTGADTRAGAFKGTSTGPYGRKGAAHQKRQADLISRSIGDELAGGKRMRGFMSLASSALADKDAWGDWAKNLGKAKDIPGGPGTSIVDGAASVRMPGGEVYGSAPAPALSAGEFGVENASILEKGFEKVKDVGGDIKDWAGNLKGAKGRKAMLELVGDEQLDPMSLDTTSVGKLPNIPDRQNDILNMMMEEYDKPILQPAYDVGITSGYSPTTGTGTFGAPVDTLSASAKNLTMPLSISERSNLSYQIQAPQITAPSSMSDTMSMGFEGMGTEDIFSKLQETYRSGLLDEQIKKMKSLTYSPFNRRR